MATYEITYRRPGGSPKGVRHKLEAASNAQARIRFLNLDWVAFTEIDIVSIEAVEPETAFVPHGVYDCAGNRKTSGPIFMPEPVPDRVRKVEVASRQMGKTAVNWRKECDRLTAEISKLADQAQALARKGKHDQADAIRAKAKELAAQRAAITKRNKGK